MRRFVAFLPLVLLLGCGGSGSSEPASSPSAAGYAAQVAAYLHQTQVSAGRSSTAQIDHPGTAAVAYDGFISAVNSVAFPPSAAVQKGQILSIARQIVNDLRAVEASLSDRCAASRITGVTPPADCPDIGAGTQFAVAENELADLVASLP